MLGCIANDLRWSDGQPFAFIISGFDAAHPIGNFIGAEIGLQVTVAGGNSPGVHYAVWNMFKAIQNTAGTQVTVIVIAQDPQLDAGKKGASIAGSTFSIRGPVAMFQAAATTVVDFVQLSLPFPTIVQV